MLLTSWSTSSCDNPSPFRSAGRVTTFQNSVMFWEQKRTASFCRISFDTAVWLEGKEGDSVEHCGAEYSCQPGHASVVAAFINAVAADGIVREGWGGSVARRPSLNAVARSSADNVFGMVGSTVPSTTERRYSCTVIPLACACAKSQLQVRGLRSRVTVIACSLLKCTRALP